MLKTQGKDPYWCPKCQGAEMVVVEIMHGIRGSRMSLLEEKRSKSRKYGFNYEITS
jgi:hypothetical protein